jgi:ABC-2 type transport system permease protein
MHVLRALLYLRFTTLHNKVAGQLRRLRQPKYLMGAIAAAAYFWFFILSRARNGRGGGPARAFDQMLGAGTLELVVAIVVTAFLVLIWVTPGDNPGLAFSEAEVTFLFPAPLARRNLIHYKLLDGLLMSLLGAVFFTLIAGGWSTSTLGALRKLGAWWSLNANLTLHQTAAALTIARLSNAGLRTVRRRIVLITGAVALVGAIIYVVNYSGAASLEWLLWPARLAVRPFLATTPGDYLLALLPAFALVGVHYFWIFRMESPFEEASIVRAQKRGEFIARMRSGRAVRLGGQARARPGPFRLADRLPVEAAFLWKNLMAAPAYLNRRVWLGAAVISLAGMRWLHRYQIGNGPHYDAFAAMIALVLLIYLFVFGPQVARNDLRGDIINADMLKAYPLPGWRILLGSLLAPTVILTAVAWIFLLVAGLGAPAGSGPFFWLTTELRVAVFLAAAIITPALCAVQLLVPNAATLMFPAWSQTNRTMGGGMDVMGQRLIFFVGQFICLIFALLPAVILAGSTVFLTQWLIGKPAAVFLAIVPVLGVFALEVGFGVWFLGPRFERLDISAELRP